MREALAERLLAQVMQWTPEDVARERPLLQAMAAFKYDEYQQFAPGMRFVESLALWLSQFRTKSERDVAYEFVKKRLIFFSNAEMAHFVSVAYPDHIRPLLIQRAAETLRISPIYVRKIIQSPEYRVLRRKCLFLGLSDGARIDVFRRSNPELSHEQIWQTYELSQEKADNVRKELEKDLRVFGNTYDAQDLYFRMIFLLDDFSGSGLSYLRKPKGDLSFSGKIAKFYKQLTSPETGLASLVRLDDLYIGIILYVATEKTRTHLEEALGELFKKPKIDWGIQIVQYLDNDLALSDVTDSEFLALTESYYDPSAEDEHTKKGGKDVKRGFAGCGLPVVLSHNTPNNSVFLLWANPEQHKVRGLFPRISRHRSET